MNVDQSDKDDGQEEGVTDPAEIPDDTSEKTGDEEQPDPNHSFDADLTETDESKADDQDDNFDTVNESASATNHIPKDSHSTYTRSSRQKATSNWSRKDNSLLQRIPDQGHKKNLTTKEEARF